MTPGNITKCGLFSMRVRSFAEILVAFRSECRLQQLAFHACVAEPLKPAEGSGTYGC